MKRSTTRIRKAFRDPVTGEKSYVWADKITYRYDELEKGPHHCRVFKRSSQCRGIRREISYLLRPNTLCMGW